MPSCTSGARFQRTMSVTPWAPTSILPLYTTILSLMPVGVSLGLETGKTASYLQGPWARGSHDQYRTFDVCTLDYSAILDFPLGNYLSLGVYVYFRLGNTQQWVMITLKVKCIAMDSNETMFVTGSADGDIKVSTILKTYVNTHMSLNASESIWMQVWDLTSQRAIQSYPQEHSRHGLFKNISQGVAQVWFGLNL